MKKICIATIVLAMAFLASCGDVNKENKTEEVSVENTDSIVEEIVEEPSFLVKSIEINKDGAVESKVTFEYDELDRLIKATSHRNIGTDDEWIIESTVNYGDGVITCDANMRKLELTLNGNGLVKKSEYILEDYGFVQRYKYKSGKLSECIDETDCGNTYFWDGGNVNIVKVYTPACDGGISFDSTFYKYGDVDRPNIDVLAFADEFGFLPDAPSVAPKGMVSKFMPTESRYNIYSSGNDMSTKITKYTYTVDDYQRVTDIEYNIKAYYDGIEEDMGNVTVKVNY
ncbi:MAG: DUF4595 domain-containing protein [Bacteroidales bacterium]|nr:DUF4595 domain-containing protein [Bacteroidales bacterium]